MKRLFLALAVVIVASSALVKAGNTKIMNSGDTTVIIENGDTTQISGLPMIGNIIKNALDDSLFYDNQTTSVTSSDTDDDWQYRSQANMREMIQNIVSYIVVGSVFIVMLALLFYYLHRRAKYRMIEKAIENNYPLPGDIMQGDNRTFMPQNNAPMRPNDPMQPDQPNQPGFAQGRETGEQNFSQLSGNMVKLTFSEISPYLNWRAFKRSFTLGITGLAFMGFFTFAHALPLVAFFSILLFMGIANAFVAYQEQKRIITMQFMKQREQQHAVATPQPAQATPSQDDQQQPPVFNPDNSH